MTSPCGESCGAVVSRTVTWNDPGTAAFPAASCAEQETTVAPSENAEPESGEHVSVGQGSKLSCAAYETTVPSGGVAWAVRSPGRDGGVWSTVHDQLLGVLEASPATALTPNEWWPSGTAAYSTGLTHGAQSDPSRRHENAEPVSGLVNVS